MLFLENRSYHRTGTDRQTGDQYQYGEGGRPLSKSFFGVGRRLAAEVNGASVLHEDDSKLLSGGLSAGASGVRSSKRRASRY